MTGWWIWTTTLGKGNYGCVYWGIDSRTNQPVAAKQIVIGSTFEEEYIKQEVESLAKLESHDNVLKFVGSVKEENVYWIFTEYCELGDVDDYCSKNALTQLSKVDIMLQVAKAVSFLHHLETPIVHRDVKPENVVLKKDRQLIAKLCDFGIARPVERLDGIIQPCQTKCGSPLYQAPEFFKEDEETGNVLYDISVDIFSLGLFFAVLQGVQDFQHIDPVLGESCKTYQTKVILNITSSWM